MCFAGLDGSDMGLTFAAYLIGFCAIGAIGLMVVSSARGWFKELPPSRTSEELEELEEL